MNHQPLGVVTVYGGPRDGERFVTPLERLFENTVITYLGVSYSISRNPTTGRWRALPAANKPADPHNDP